MLFISESWKKINFKIFEKLIKRILKISLGMPQKRPAGLYGT